MATLKVPSVYLTISAALAVANPFDVIKVSPGSYTENIVVNTSNIKFKASGPGVILDGLVAGSGIGFQINAPNTMINGFTIQNFDTGIQINNNYNKIVNSTITNILTSHAIEIFGNYNTLSKNVMDSVNSHVVYVFGCVNNKIKNNTMTVIAPGFCCIFLNSFTQFNSVTHNQISITPGCVGIRLDQGGNDVIRKNTLA